MARQGKKLSQKIKDSIIADYKAGIYDSKTALARAYKIDRKTLYKILSEESVETGVNMEIVQAGLEYELLKKATLSTIEQKAVEKAIQKRLEMIGEDVDIMLNNRKLIKALQRKTAEKIKNDEIQTIKDIKYTSSAVKDFEAVANPRTVNLMMNNQQNVEVNQQVAQIDRKERIKQIRKEFLKIDE